MTFNTKVHTPGSLAGVDWHAHGIPAADTSISWGARIRVMAADELSIHLYGGQQSDARIFATPESFRVLAQSILDCCDAAEDR